MSTDTEFHAYSWRHRECPFEPWDADFAHDPGDQWGHGKPTARARILGAAIEDLRRVLGSYDKTLVDQAVSFLAGMEAKGISFTDLPKPEVTLEPLGNAIAIEWIKPDRRFGIGIESDPKNSSWFYVSKRSAGGRHAAGTLADDLGADALAWFKDEPGSH